MVKMTENNCEHMKGYIHTQKMLIQSHFDMAASGQRSASRWISSQRLMLLILLCWCYWLSSDETKSPLQVHVAALILRAVWEPPRLDPRKLKACAPKLPEPGQLKDLIAEARDPKWKSPKKRRSRTSPERPGLWRCCECEQWLPATAFNVRNRHGMQFLETYCKECSNERRRWHHRTLRGGFVPFSPECQT